MLGNASKAEAAKKVRLIPISGMVEGSIRPWWGVGGFWESMEREQRDDSALCERQFFNV